MKSRLQYIVKNEGLSNQKFASEIGVSPAAITHILSGRNNPSLEIIAKIATRFPHYALRWLILGELPILTVNHVPQDVSTFDKAENNLFSAQNQEEDVKCTCSPMVDHDITPHSVYNPVVRNQLSTNTEDNIKPNSDNSVALSSSSCSDKLIVCFPDGTFKEFTRQK